MQEAAKRIWEGRPHILLNHSQRLWHIRSWEESTQKSPPNWYFQQPTSFLLADNKHDLLFFLLFRLSQTKDREEKRNVGNILICDEFVIHKDPLELMLVTSMIDLNRDIHLPASKYPSSLMEATDSFQATCWLQRNGLPGFVQTPDHLNIHRITDVMICHPHPNLLYNKSMTADQALELCKDEEINYSN